MILKSLYSYTILKGLKSHDLFSNAWGFISKYNKKWMEFSK